SVSDPGVFTGGNISRDGQKIAFVIDDPQDDTTNIWSYDLTRHLKARLTFEPTVGYFPVWSPAGDRLFFDSNRLGLSQLFRVSSAASDRWNASMLQNNPIIRGRGLRMAVILRFADARGRSSQVHDLDFREFWRKEGPATAR